MRNMTLAAILVASPAAAQTTLRAPVSGVSAVSGLGASFDGARFGTTPLPTMMMPTLSALALAPSLVPAPVQPALAANILAAAAKPIEGSSIAVLLDDSADMTQKTAALDSLFENSAIPGSVGPFPATEYTSLKAAIKARGVKAGLTMQASRTKREGRYWFTVNILDDEKDFEKIANLFEMDSKGWSYAGIPTNIQLRGTPIDPVTLTAQGKNEFTQAPGWFDVSKLKFDAVIKSGTGGIAVMRYGWRSQYEMSVFAFPGGESISFKEYPASPMGNPKQSFEAALQTAAARKAAAKILRAAQGRNPVSGKDKATLDAILGFLEGA